MKICCLQGSIVVSRLYIFNNLVSRVSTMICVKLFQIYSSKRLTHASLTMSPLNTLQNDLIETWCSFYQTEFIHILRIFCICRWPVPLVLKKTSKKLLNILKNEELIFYTVALGLLETCQTFTVHIPQTSLCSLNIFFAIFELLMSLLGKSLT